MTSRPVPDSLLDPGLAPVWAMVRRRLDRSGPERRGTIVRPALDPGSTLTLGSLLGRKPTKRLDLGHLEAALVAHDIGDDLCSALTRLGHPPSAAAAQRRADRERSEAARAALSAAVASWDEPWAVEWANEVARSGMLGSLGGDDVDDLVADVRRLLDRLDRLQPAGASRTEVAAALYGSAHALDANTKLAGAVTRALRRRVDPPEGGEPAERELWEAAGILWDRVSAPVLTWGLPIVGISALDIQIRAASAGALPVHVSLLALQKYPLAVSPRTPVLVVENPRLVEAAAERDLPCGVVASNGNPTTAVMTLVQQLQRSGAAISYHGDFDAPGIAICRRMHVAGCTPWMMGASDYEAAVGLAQRSGVQLASDPHDCGATPWDPALQEVFGRRRLVVHEEFVLDRVLDDFSGTHHPPQPR